MRPYRVTRKRVDFFRFHVGAYCIRPTERHSKNGECEKRDTFLGYSFHKWNVCGAYAIRPYHVTGKRIAFSISIMYPAIFPGLGRGLDFLLPSFLVSRQEKKVEARRIRPTEYHFNDDECRKRGTFLGYRDHAIRKRITFLGYSFHRWNVCGAYAIRPYRVTRKRVDFLRSHVGAYCIRPTGRHSKNGECAKRVNFSGYNDLIIRKRITFSGYIDLGI